jgi:hypothetical protein
LKADEAAIRAEERVYRASDKGLSQAEGRDLEKDLNKTFVIGPADVARSMRPTP